MFLPQKQTTLVLLFSRKQIDYLASCFQIEMHAQDLFADSICFLRSWQAHCVGLCINLQELAMNIPSLFVVCFRSWQLISGYRMLQYEKQL